MTPLTNRVLMVSPLRSFWISLSTALVTCLFSGRNKHSLHVIRASWNKSQYLCKIVWPTRQQKPSMNLFYTFINDGRTWISILCRRIRNVSPPSFVQYSEMFFFQSTRKWMKVLIQNDNILAYKKCDFIKTLGKFLKSMSVCMTLPNIN